MDQSEVGLISVPPGERIKMYAAHLLTPAEFINQNDSHEFKTEKRQAIRYIVNILLHYILHLFAFTNVLYLIFMIRCVS